MALVEVHTVWLSLRLIRVATATYLTYDSGLHVSAATLPFHLLDIKIDTIKSVQSYFKHLRYVISFQTAARAALGATCITGK